MILYGASGHAKVIIDILEAMGIEVSELFDDNNSLEKLQNIKVSIPRETTEKLIISIGNNRIRKKIVESNSYTYGVAIHPTAVLSPYAHVGEGTVVMQGAIIQSDVVVGKHCIVNTGATIDQECQIEDYVHVSPNATLCGNVKVGEESWIGAGSVIIPGIKIGKNSVVGAGSVVIRDIPDNCIAAGNPCKIIKQKDNSMKEDLLIKLNFGGGKYLIYNSIDVIGLCNLKIERYAA